MASEIEELREAQRRTSVKGYVLYVVVFFAIITSGIFTLQQNTEIKRLALEGEKLGQQNRLFLQGKIGLPGGTSDSAGLASRLLRLTA